MHEFWPFLLHVLILLAVAMVLGAICERFRQSAIVGYLLAGTVLGPNALAVFSDTLGVEGIAELGVALLLFSIGLEFSIGRLRSFGGRSLGLGGLQLVGTIAFGALIVLALGRPISAAITLGAIIALSSTACVLRTLVDRSEIDSVHGRHALATLLLQDVAVVPLVLIVAALGSRGDAGPVTVLVGIAEGLGYAAGLVAVFWAINRYGLPVLMRSPVISRNRELPVLFAIVTALGATVAAHEFGISPALGAFIAGVMLGESHVATQIRADVGPLRTVFVTLFFASIGMLADFAWIANHPLLVAGGVVAVIVGKAVVVWGMGRAIGLANRHALATGIGLAQVGEFSFVLAGVAVAAEAPVISDATMKLLVSVTIATLFVTPYLIRFGPTVGGRVETWLMNRGWIKASRVPWPALDETGDGHGQSGHVLVVGFGPSGRAVATALRDQGERVLVLDLNPQTVSRAGDEQLAGQIGDATSAEVLEHAGVTHAAAVVVTLPDHRATETVVRQVRRLSPGTPLIVRARYHMFVDDLQAAGAHAVIDEEAAVGQSLSDQVVALLGTPEGERA